MGKIKSLIAPFLKSTEDTAVKQIEQEPVRTPVSPSPAAEPAVSVSDLTMPPSKRRGPKEIAEEYTKQRGITGQVRPFKNVDETFARKVADAYSAMPHAPDDPKVQRAYNALISETEDQYKAIMSSGLKVSRIEPGMPNPYKTSKDLHRDITENNHMWYYPTESGYGTEGVGAVGSHPMLRQTELTDGKNKLLANDVFRIVHDYFGHVKEATSFGPKGEEKAYRIHKQMYSPEAQKALTSETRGQNSWVNYGPNAEQNRKNPQDTIYAEQKAGLLPDWALEDYEN